MTEPHSATGIQLLARFREAAFRFSRARQVHADMLLEFGDVRAIVRIRDGRVVEIVDRSVPLQSWDFAVKGSELGWIKFWHAMPEAGWHDILALNKRREFSIEGNLQPLMAHLQFIKDLLASARGSVA